MQPRASLETELYHFICIAKLVIIFRTRLSNMIIIFKYERKEKCTLNVFYIKYVVKQRLQRLCVSEDCTLLP